MNKELFELLDKMTEKKLTSEQKTNFSHSVGDLISKAENSIIIMSDTGVACVGRGIDVLATISKCINQLAKDKFRDKDLWEATFKSALEDIEDDEDEEDIDDEKAEELLEKLKELNKFLESMKK